MTEPAQDTSLVKQEYLTKFFAKYTDLVQYVNNLPIHQQIKLNSLMRLDEGMFWVREGIVHLQTAIPEAPPKLGDFDNPAPIAEPEPLA